MELDDIERVICDLGRTIADNAAAARSKPVNDPDRIALEQQIELRKAELAALWLRLTSSDQAGRDAGGDRLQGDNS